MSTTEKSSSTGSGDRKNRTPLVRSAEAGRWTTLRGKLTVQERRDALRRVAAKMR